MKLISNMMNPHKKSRKGFTLIELLIVVSILAIVAAIAVPNLSRFMGEGEREAWEADLSTLVTATLAYRSEHEDEWPLVDDTGGLGAPVFDGDLDGDPGQFDDLAHCNGLIDMEPPSGISDYLAAAMDSACSFNYESVCAVDTDVDLTGSYGHWCWYVNTSGAIEGLYFAATGEAPSGPNWDNADSPDFP